MTRLPVPDKFTDEHGNRWRLIAGPFDRPREDDLWKSAVDSLARGRISSYPWLHEDGRFYLYRDARGFVEWSERRAALFRSVRTAAFALLACAMFAGCKARREQPPEPIVENSWEAASMGDLKASTVENRGDLDLTMEVRKYPKVLGTYAVGKVYARAVRVEVIGDPTKTCAFLTRDPSWTVRDYVDGRELLSPNVPPPTVRPIWVVVECGKVKASAIP